MASSAPAGMASGSSATGMTCRKNTHCSPRIERCRLTSIGASKLGDEVGVLIGRLGVAHRPRVDFVILDFGEQADERGALRGVGLGITSLIVALDDDVQLLHAAPHQPAQPGVL